MSTHIHPALRAREDAMYNAGLIPDWQSAGYTVLKDQEIAGLTFRESPKATYYYVGNTFTPAQIPAGS
jgi:hypothetical protein